MSVHDQARTIMDAVEADEQWVRALRRPEQTAELRRAVRAEARLRGIRVRTGFDDGVLTVVRLDAALWATDTATMKRILAPPAGADPF